MALLHPVSKPKLLAGIPGQPECQPIEDLNKGQDAEPHAKTQEAAQLPKQFETLNFGICLSYFLTVSIPETGSPSPSFSLPFICEKKEKVHGQLLTWTNWGPIQ